MTIREYVTEHVRYPEVAAENGIAGTVYVQFTISKNGDVTDIRVLRSIHDALDSEAVKGIVSSPGWTPGKQRGRPVNVRFTFPIHFVLQV